MHARVHAGTKPLREALISTSSEMIIAWTSFDAELYVSSHLVADSKKANSSHIAISMCDAVALFYAFPFDWPPCIASQVTFSPLVSKPVAIAACQKLVRRLKKEQSALFLLSPAK